MLTARWLRLLLIAAVGLWAVTYTVMASVYHVHTTMAVIAAILLGLVFGYALWRIDRKAFCWVGRIYCAAWAIVEFAYGDVARGVVAVLWGASLWSAITEPKPQPLNPKRVKASALAGTVEYGSLHFAGIRVEECAPDWVQQFSEVKTDEDGRFALPPRESPVHYVRVSWQPGVQCRHFAVRLDPEAKPMRVHLEPRRHSLQYPA